MAIPQAMWEEQSQLMLLHEFNQFLGTLHTEHVLVGKLGGSGSELKMPIQHKDKRRLTWVKFTREMIDKIVRGNAPLTKSDCWMIEGPRTDRPRTTSPGGYPSKKLWGRGERNRWRVHR